MRLDGKVVLLTGASSGIGKAMAILFAKEGAKVIGVARREDKLKEIAEQAKEYTGEIVAFEGDVSIQEDINNMVDFAINKFGRIDVLVNNAGVMDNFEAIADVSDELWEKVISVNLTAPMKVIRKVIPIMLKQEKGNIINTSSLAGLYGGRSGATYAASKFGLTGLTKNTAYMYATSGIRCNSIHPGGVDTDITKNIKPNEFGMGRMSKGTSNNPRSGSPEEIANIALFLASDESSYINGASIVADGGWSAY